MGGCRKEESNESGEAEIPCTLVAKASKSQMTPWSRKNGPGQLEPVWSGVVLADGQNHWRCPYCARQPSIGGNIAASCPLHYCSSTRSQPASQPASQASKQQTSNVDSVHVWSVEAQFDARPRLCRDSCALGSQRPGPSTFYLPR